MGSEYSSLKMAWWAMKEGWPPPAPKQVQVILSDLCNQDCSFCAYRMSGYSSNQLFMAGAEPAAFGHNNPKRWMDTSRAMNLMGELKEAGVLAVQFTGGGEPTVHPAHEAIFRYARDIGLRCSLVTNGVKMGDLLIGEVLPYFDWVRVSVDAGDASMYASIRRVRPSHFDMVWSNVRVLAARLREKKSPCLLGIGYVVTPENYLGIVSGARLAKEAGASYIRFSAVFSPEDEGPYLPIYYQIKDAIATARRLYADDSFTIHDLFGERIQDLVDGPPDYRVCAYQYYTSYIGADMNMYRCCVLAYNERGRIAGINLANRSFAEAWASDERKRDFEAFDARGCDRCQFNPRNRPMAYLLSESPKHKEFP